MKLKNWLGTHSLSSESDLWLLIQVPEMKYDISSARTIVDFFAKATGAACGFIQQDQDSDQFRLLAKTGGELPKQFTSVAEWFPLEELIGPVDFPFVFHPIEIAPDTFMYTLVHRDGV